MGQRLRRKALLLGERRYRMTVDVLCRVVDNFGDIGFAYRLARALSEPPALAVASHSTNRVRLVVDDLAAFAQLCPRVDPLAPCQTVDGILVVRRDDPGEAAIRPFLDERPRVALELYACGRPDWFESILFDERDTVPRLVVNVEYLTAEPWAADFHKLPSLTRSPLVRKSIFMPGFIPGTGGLLEDAAFRSLLDENSTTAGRLAIRNRLVSVFELAVVASALEPAGASPADALPADALPAGAVPADALWVTVFSYERDFSRIVDDLARLGNDGGDGAGTQRPVYALVAAGRGSGPFFDAWNRAGKPFPARALPMLAQGDWDALLVASDFSIVRGEESFARAILAGNPFLWQCYPFGTGGQLPKVHAFLDVIARYVGPDAFTAYERATLAFNDDRAGIAGLDSIFRHWAALSAAFRSLSRDARKLGNLADNLLTFLRDSGYTP
jgi:hypothetical protein